jgi:glycosyltransferase involved in cell wall biosynthesis
VRLFICDPVCVQPLGHNVLALSYFSKAFVHLFDKVVPLCCRLLPKKTVEAYGFAPRYGFYYHDYINVLESDHAVEHSLNGYADPLEAEATKDAIDLLAEYEIDADDTLFFPSLDIYGVIGLLNALSGRPPRLQPRIFLRFIGVMENASHTYRDPEKELVRRLVIARTEGCRLALSAETPRLADRLAEMLNVPVAVTPYPAIGEAFPYPKVGPMICFCPGSSRFDKGFLDLKALFYSVRERDPDLTIQFVMQSLPERESGTLQKYISQIYALPGVELLPSMISEEEMLKQYKRASVVLLPYDNTIYKWRGSAALMEAACFGRPVVSLDEMAFCDQIRYYGLGTVCTSISAMADTVLELAKMSRDTLAQRAIQGRRRLTADMDGSYDQWLRTAL